MRSFGLLAILLSLANVHAQDAVTWYGELQGNSSAPWFSNDTFKKAAQRPDAISVVNFQQSDRDWTWTLQISNVSYANITDRIPDAHVAYTTWHIAAETNGSYNPEKPGLYSSAPTCIFYVDFHFPSSVSDNWNDDSARCTSAIGSECESTILDAMTVSDECDSSNWLAHDFNDSCGGMTGHHGFSIQSYQMSSSNVKNDTYAWNLSNAYKAGNTTAYQYAKDRLRLIGLTGPGGKGVYCNRVAAADASNDSKNGATVSSSDNGSNDSDGDGNDDSDSDGSNTSLAGRASSSSLLAIGVAVFSLSALGAWL